MDFTGGFSLNVVPAPSTKDAKYSDAYNSDTRFYIVSAHYGNTTFFRVVVPEDIVSTEIAHVLTLLPLVVPAINSAEAEFAARDAEEVVS